MCPTSRFAHRIPARHETQSRLQDRRAEPHGALWEPSRFKFCRDRRVATILSVQRNLR
ncbi:hypothetical protein PMIN01_09202 [Paraphaeosphaeria minitans]|uniref:Uncharacterized protein n=1 Tax=Paraphaeosphaeria minitans TaxID=565426 RepID=A0A9P6GBF6_9PLEO|nr:hypothetical protein PMIN01_09202 [Paraphaeosphaeria minitans]